MVEEKREKEAAGGFLSSCWIVYRNEGVDWASGCEGRRTADGGGANSPEWLLPPPLAVEKEDPFPPSFSQYNSFFSFFRPVPQGKRGRRRRKE